MGQTILSFDLQVLIVQAVIDKNNCIMKACCIHMYFCSHTKKKKKKMDIFFLTER